MKIQTQLRPDLDTIEVFIADLPEGYLPLRFNVFVDVYSTKPPLTALATNIAHKLSDHVRDGTARGEKAWRLIAADIGPCMATNRH